MKHITMIEEIPCLSSEASWNQAIERAKKRAEGDWEYAELFSINHSTSGHYNGATLFLVFKVDGDRQVKHIIKQIKDSSFLQLID